MDIMHLILLAFVQGITEFLPISSSAHLILAPILLGFEDQGPLIDLAVHVGTLLAVIIAFWQDVVFALKGVGQLIIGQWNRRAARLALRLIVATIPAVLFGLFLYSIDAMEHFRSIEVIGWTTLIFGAALYIADIYSPRTERISTMTLWGALLVGLSQALAFIPGTSRSGVTMTTARFLGLERTEAARFSMLLAIPLILISGAAGAYDILESGNMALGQDALIAAALAFVAALLAIRLFMKWISRASMTPFVIYRMILGVLLLMIAYS